MILTKVIISQLMPAQLDHHQKHFKSVSLHILHTQYKFVFKY
jgi:hypothetical protein